MGETTVSKNKQGYGYKYTDIAQIHEYLESKGWSYWQYTDRVGDDDYIFTVPIMDNKELASRRGCRIVQGALLSKSNAAQEQGAAITYARRYSLLMAFGLATDDDDAECMTRGASAKTDTKKGKGTASKENADALIGEAHIATIEKEMDRTGITSDTLYKLYKIKDFRELTTTQYMDMMEKFKATKDKEA